MVTRVFVDQTLVPSSSIELDKRRVHYLKNVLRLKSGDDLQIFGSCGKEYHARIESLDRSMISLQLGKELSTRTESPLDIHLIQAISKGQRMDYSVQKATELGVTRIIPVYTKNCQSRLSKAQYHKKQQHWSAIAIHAAEQSKRQKIPVVESIIDFTEYMNEPSQGIRLLLHETCQQQFDFSSIKTPTSVALIVGPEGGLTEKEVALAIKNQSIPLQIGPRVLRTETVAPVMLGLIQWFWGDMARL